MSFQSELTDIYNDNFDKIYKFFYYKTQSIQLAEDLTSQTFLAFAENLNNNKYIKNNRAFLYGIAKNIFYTYLKSKQYIICMDLEKMEFSEYVNKFVDFFSSDIDPLEKIKPLIKLIPKNQRKINLCKKFVSN